MDRVLDSQLKQRQDGLCWETRGEEMLQDTSVLQMQLVLTGLQKSNRSRCKDFEGGLKPWPSKRSWNRKRGGKERRQGRARQSNKDVELQLVPSWRTLEKGWKRKVMIPCHRMYAQRITMFAVLRFVLMFLLQGIKHDRTNQDSTSPGPHATWQHLHLHPACGFGHTALSSKRISVAVEDFLSSVSPQHQFLEVRIGLLVFGIGAWCYFISLDGSNFATFQGTDSGKDHGRCSLFLFVTSRERKTSYAISSQRDDACTTGKL